MVTIDKITHSRWVEPALDDYTDKIINVLTPELRREHMGIKDCVIFGKKRSGKTWLEKAIAERIVDHYGAENVSVYMSNSFLSMIDCLDKPTNRCVCGKLGLSGERCKSCGKVIEKPMQEKRVNVLIIDDPLRRYLSRGGTTREQRDAIGEYEAIAHRLEEKLESKTGVGIIIIGSQEYMGLEKTFRDAPVVIFKTEMGEDQAMVDELLVLPKARKKLAKLSNDIYLDNKHSARNESIVKLGANYVGKCVFEPFELDYTVWVGERYITKRKVDKRKLLAQFVEEVMVAGDIHPEMKGFAHHVKGFLHGKHDDMYDAVRSLAPAVCDRVKYEYRRLSKQKLPSEQIKRAYFLNPKSGFKYTYHDLHDDLLKLLCEKRKAGYVSCMLDCYREYMGGSSQQHIASELYYNGSEYGTSQSSVSRMIDVVKGALNYLRGLNYEIYVAKALKKKQIHGLFDKDVKHVMYFGNEKQGVKRNCPDLVVKYKNDDVDVVACKCFDDDSYVVNVNREDSSISPEVDTFVQLSRNKETMLANSRKIKSDGDVRLVIMMCSVNKDLPCESYVVYKKPEELPKSVSFNKVNLLRGNVKNADWEDIVR